MNIIPKTIFLKDDGIFPNSELPVLLYKQAFQIPALFGGIALKKLFRKHGWTNNWRHGIYTFNHYHSTAHEVLGVIKGSAHVQLGGPDGVDILLEKGDVLVIPAGVAHRNMGEEKAVICIGGYPNGRNFDINKGMPGERPGVDQRIAAVPVPDTDPVTGLQDGLPSIWRANKRMNRAGKLKD
ncbi:cupin domain-containing protein [Taibaiella soli]|uniref:Cupin n=1 Tax=Taibaiella soli TaxID=1649169 RepID=A0A2W2BBG4_9BACT|nr:cupin domain-containing protein [Taibaiella soli]PZF70976.1 cupin [Taibaiella soli]